MKVILEIPDEEIKEQLKENIYVVEGEGEKGSVDIAMLYTNGTLDFICVEGREHFVRLKYKTLPDNATNGDMIKAMFPNAEFDNAMPFTDGRWEIMNLDTENRVRAMYEPTQLRTYANWWKSPYKGGIRRWE